MRLHELPNLNSFSVRPPSHFDRFTLHQGPHTSKQKRLSSPADTRVNRGDSPTSAPPSYHSSSGNSSGSVAPRGS
ncbi:hypothetical protein LTR87_017284, partial [Friedmanniomyces endolithicus]